MHKHTQATWTWFTVLGVAVMAPADTLYWAGGTTDIANGTPLPRRMTDLSGTWNTTTKNWSVDANGTTYTNWNNARTDNRAYFGAGVTNDLTTPAPTITLGTDITVNRMDITDPANGTNPAQYTFTGARTLTLNGTSPTINPSGGTNYRPIFSSSLLLAGSNGLTITGGRGINAYGDASGLTGLIDASAVVQNQPPFATAFLPGFRLGSTDIRLRAGHCALEFANGAANTALDDGAVISFLGPTAVFQPLAYGTAAVSTETIRKVLLTCGYGTLDPSWRVGGSTPNGQVILGDATTGLDRGTWGKGMFVLATQADHSIRTDVVVQHGLTPGSILPWAMTTYGQMVQLNASKVLQSSVITDVPSTDPNLWVAGSDYRMTAVPTVPLNNDLTLNSLSAYFSGLHGTNTLASGKTLTLTRGMLSVLRTGSTVSLTLLGGKLTTPANTLYLNVGNGGPALNLYTWVDGTFDVVCGGNGNITFSGTNANTYAGTTYVAGATASLLKPTANAPAIPGDLVVLGGDVRFCGASTQNQIYRYANVTIEELGSMTGAGNGGTQDFGGVFTLNGGTFLGNNNTSRHAFDAPGTGLRFNGGKFTAVWNAGSGTYYLLTDVSYAATSTKQAVFENAYSLSTQLLRLTEAGKGAAVRTFAVTDSATLDAATPEMAMYMELTEANTTEKAGLTKTGDGALAVRCMAYALTGNITVNGGTLLSAGAWRAVSRVGTTVNASVLVTGLSTTTDLVVGQPITGTGMPSGTTILSIDSATQIALSRAATASGTPTLSFTGRGAMGKAQVLTGTTALSAVITGLSSTQGLAVRQPVSAASGIPAGAYIASIDSATQITISAAATVAGSRALTFTGGSAVGRGPVTVGSTGTLSGEGVAGSITVASGGTLDAGLTPSTVGTLLAGSAVTFQGGSTLKVDIVDAASSDQLQVFGDLALDGAVSPNLLGAYNPPTGQWTIATYTGTASGSLAAPAGYSVSIDAANQRILLRKSAGGTVLVIR